MSSESNQVSNELVSWLKMLTLPTWMRVGMALITVLIFLVALALVIFGIWYKDKDLVSSGVTALIIAMPVSLVIVALVFGADGSEKLQSLTVTLLDAQIPKALEENFRNTQLGQDEQFFEVIRNLRGCIADYSLRLRTTGHAVREVKFRLELNVYKVNFIFWLPTNLDIVKGWRSDYLLPYKSSLAGAIKEGYTINEHPVCLTIDGQVRYGIVLIKTFEQDFLLRPNLRLYFAQDLAFFIRSIFDLDVEHG